MLFTRFLSGFTDDELSIVWKYSGLGSEEIGGPEEYPGRRVMAKFLYPAPGTWAGIIRRAVRTGDKGAALVLMLAALQGGPIRPARVRAPALAPRRLASQCQRIATAPTRGSPWASGVGAAPT